MEHTKQYDPRCVMCVERPYEILGLCRRCFTVTAADARAKGVQPLTYAKELEESYRYIYNLKASHELSDKLRLCLSLQPKKGRNSFTIRPGVSFHPYPRTQACKKILG